MPPPVLDKDWATVSSKGQVTIPKRIRELLRIEPGHQVRMVPLRSGNLALVPRNRTVEDFIGFLHDPDRKPMTIEEMNEAIALGGAKSGMQGMESWDEPEWEEEERGRR